MTISTAPARSEYTANAAQTIFNYTFKIFENTDLNVYITPSGQDANDSTDLTTAYTVTGLGDEDGGTIILTTGTNVDDLVTIVSDVPSSRSVDYQNNGDFRPTVVNADFDRVISIVKKIEDTANRTVLLQQSQQDPKPLTLPKPLPSFLLRWNSGGTGLENHDPSTVSNDEIAADKVVINHPSLLSAVADPDLKQNQAVNLKERTTGNGGGAMWDVVLASTVTPNTFNIVQCTGVPTLALVLRENGSATALSLGVGTTISIGAGGVFATLNQALNFLIRVGDIDEEVTLNLLTGFVMQEQVFADAYDTGKVRITSVDAVVTIQRSSLTDTVPDLDLSATPAFLAVNNGTLPIIDCLFSMDTTGAADSIKQHGVMVARGGSVVVDEQAGVINATGRGLYGTNGRAYARQTIWDDAGVYGVRAGNGSVFNIRESSAKRAGVNGLHANNSIVTAVGLNVADSLGRGIDCRGGANVNFNSGIATGCATDSLFCENAVIDAELSVLSGSNRGIEANGGIIRAKGADLSGMVDRCINCNSSAIVDATNATIATAGFAAVAGFSGSKINVIGATVAGATVGLSVGSGATIIANGVTTTYSKTPNVLGNDGKIITDDVTFNDGIAVMLSGNFSVVVSHGLTVTPSAKYVSVVANSSTGAVSGWYISSVGASTFTIATLATVLADSNFAWQVNVR